MKQIAAAVSLAVIAGAASASAITVQTGSTFESNLADAAAYKSDVIALVGAPVALASFDNAQFSLSNSAFEATITFDVTAPTTFDFRAGVDFGGGGALFLDGTALDYKGTDMWWADSYNNASQFLAGTSTTPLGVGVHTLSLYGFENCCSGNMQVQYSTNGGSTFTSFSSTDTLPAVPEAQNFAMLLAGLGLVATVARRRSNKQA
jgi:hypothetical protein